MQSETEGGKAKRGTCRPDRGRGRNREPQAGPAHGRAPRERTPHATGRVKTNAKGVGKDAPHVPVGLRLI